MSNLTKRFQPKKKRKKKRAFPAQRSPCELSHPSVQIHHENHFHCYISLNSEANYQGDLSVCCYFPPPPLFPLCLSPCLSLISHSCPVVRHIGFALSSPAPCRCFILATPSAHPPPAPFFSLLLLLLFFHSTSLSSTKSSLVLFFVRFFFFFFFSPRSGLD